MLTLKTALDSDVTRVPGTISPVLPLADAGWTLCSAHTSDEHSATVIRFTDTPGAITVSVQIPAITLPVDWRTLMVVPPGRIAAKTV